MVATVVMVAMEATEEVAEVTEAAMEATEVMEEDTEDTGTEDTATENDDWRCSSRNGADVHPPESRLSARGIEPRLPGWISERDLCEAGCS
ncbi:hypothetical protein MRX96_003292 [Rhipicephalus microplus]